MFVPGSKDVSQAPVNIVGGVGDITSHTGIQLLADSANTDTIYIGGSNVGPKNGPGVPGFPLTPGSGIFVPTPQADKLYAMSPTGTQSLNFFVVSEVIRD